MRLCYLFFGICSLFFVPWDLFFVLWDFNMSIQTDNYQLTFEESSVPTGKLKAEMQITSGNYVGAMVGVPPEGSGLKVLDYGDYSFNWDDGEIIAAFAQFIFYDPDRYLTEILDGNWLDNSLQPEIEFTVFKQKTGETEWTKKFIGDIVWEDLEFNEAKKTVTLQFAPRTDRLKRIAPGEIPELDSDLTIQEALQHIYNKVMPGTTVLVKHNYKKLAFSEGVGGSWQICSVTDFRFNFKNYAARKAADTLYDLLSALCQDFVAYSGITFNGEAFFIYLGELGALDTQTVDLKKVKENKGLVSYAPVDYVEVTVDDEVPEFTKTYNVPFGDFNPVTIVYHEQIKFTYGFKLCSDVSFNTPDEGMVALHYFRDLFVLVGGTKFYMVDLGTNYFIGLAEPGFSANETGWILANDWYRLKGRMSRKRAITVLEDGFSPANKVELNGRFFYLTALKENCAKEKSEVECVEIITN